MYRAGTGPHSSIEAVHRRSLEDPTGFWAEAARDIDWIRPAQRVLDDSDAPLYRWFVDGVLNTCHNALDRHVEGGRAEALALIYDSPVTSTVQRLTYRELRAEVARFAGALAAHGVGKGDRVVISMPMVPRAVIAMLACARIGAVHSVVFGGFAANELATRIEHAKPKAIVFGSCCSPRRRPSGRSRRKTPTDATARDMTCPVCGICSSPANGWTRTPTTGPPSC